LNLTLFKLTGNLWIKLYYPWSTISKS